jgi:hypothetical protein
VIGPGIFEDSRPERILEADRQVLRGVSGGIKACGRRGLPDQHRRTAPIQYGVCDQFDARSPVGDQEITNRITNSPAFFTRSTTSDQVTRR